jgi:hypothetical protein
MKCPLDREQLLFLVRTRRLELTPEQVEQAVAASASGELADADLETVTAGKFYYPSPYPWGPPIPWMGGGAVFVGGPFNAIAIRW